METNVSNTAVGAFVILLLTALVLCIIWLSAGFSIEHYSTYQINMQESVNGLSIDAAVEYNGVEVGKVKSIILDETNPHLVILLLNIKKGTPITKGTVATLTTRGITGITYISLKDNGSRLERLKAIDHQPYPVIPTAPSFFLRIDTAIRKLNTSLTHISDAMLTLLDKQNVAAIKQTLTNLADITTTLAKNNQELNILMKNTAHASQEFTPLLQSSTSAMIMLETQTLPAANRLMNNLNGISRNMLDVSDDLRRNPAVLIRGKQPQPLGPGEQ